MTKEEAIRRIKSWNLDSDDMEVLSVVIPELAESEDEKVRKELLEEIEFIVPHEDETDSEGLILPSYRTRIDRYKSYLEKQKEQTEELSIRLNGVMQEYVKSGKDEEEQEHRLKCYQLFWDALGDSEFFEQKEQKPAEWSEDDADFINMLILHFNYLINKGGDSVETYKSYREKLKSLRPQPHCKPSEEQMEALNEIINTLAASKHPHESDYLFNRLNGLRKSLKKL